MKWEKGRQGSGYWKLKFLQSKLFKCDTYLLWYPKGSFIDFHTDPVPEGYEHHRINIFLKQAKIGGEFVIQEPNKAMVDWKRLQYFRPDKCSHAVRMVEKGTRWVLSIGWLRRIK